MARKEQPADMFMNFKSIRALFDTADSSAVTEEKSPTGLSIRGQLLMLIHQVEWIFEVTTAMSQASFDDYSIQSILSTRAGSTVLPGMDAAGVVDAVVVNANTAADGANNINSWIRQPYKSQWLPPVPLAAQSLSVYVKTNTDVTAMRGQTALCRIGFTTAPLDAAAYTEIAEAWGW